MAERRQQGVQLLGAQRPPEFGLLLLDLGEQVFPEFGDDVGSLGLGQMARDGGQVAIQNLHHGFS